MEKTHGIKRIRKWEIEKKEGGRYIKQRERERDKTREKLEKEGEKKGERKRGWERLNKARERKGEKKRDIFLPPSFYVTLSVFTEREPEKGKYK